MSGTCGFLAATVHLVGPPGVGGGHDDSFVWRATELPTAPSSSATGLAHTGRRTPTGRVRHHFMKFAYRDRRKGRAVQTVRRRRGRPVVLDTWDSDPTVESVRGGVHRAGITGSPDTLLRILLRSSGSGTPFPAASCDRAERTSTGDRGCPHAHPPAAPSSSTARQQICQAALPATTVIRTCGIARERNAPLTENRTTAELSAPYETFRRKTVSRLMQDSCI